MSNENLTLFKVYYINYTGSYSLINIEAFSDLDGAQRFIQDYITNDDFLDLLCVSKEDIKLLEGE